MKTFVRTFILMVTLLSIAVPATAQSQQKGIVKTRGTSSVKGSPISGVSIIQRGGSTTVSGKNGSFVLPLTKNSYTLKEVRKAGFSLVDPDILKYEHKYSDEPFPILLEDQQKLRAERNKLERKIERNYRDKYRAKEDSLQNLYDQNKITIEKLNQEMEALEKEKDKIPALTKELTQIRLKLDYDYLNEFDRKFYTYFENEEYGKCDSLINSRGDLQSELNKWHTRDNAITANQERINQEQLIQNKMVEDNTLIGNELADRIYKKFLTFKATLQLDSAAHWIAERAKIGKTNIQWQMDAGDFLSEYRADYDNALKFFNRALELSIELYGEQSYEVINIYNSIGTVYYNKNDHNNCLNYYDKILGLLTKMGDDLSPEMAVIYYQIANVYRDIDDDDDALSFYNKAKSINDISEEKINGLYQGIALLYKKQGHLEEALKYMKTELEVRNHNKSEDSDYSDIYNNIGSIYKDMDDFENAIENYTKALQVSKDNFGELHPHIAVIYNNLGTVYSEMGNFQESLNYFLKAVEINKEILGENSLEIANNKNNLATIYYELGHYNDALDCYVDAINIFSMYYGEIHSSISLCYNGIAHIFSTCEQYAEAEKYFNKALSIDKAIDSSDNLNTARDLEGLGSISWHNEDYEMALKYSLEALKIRENLLGSDHSLTIKTYNNIATIYGSMSEYDKAIGIYQEQIPKFKLIYGENSSQLTNLYENIATQYYYKKEYDMAVEYYNKSIDINAMLYGKESVRLNDAYAGIALVYENGYKDYDSALKYSTMALNSYIKEYGENHFDVANTYGLISNLCSKYGNYEQSIINLSKALNIYVTLYGEKHPRVAKIKNSIFIDTYMMYTHDLSHPDSEFKEYINEAIFSVKVQDGLPAAIQGMTGKYYLLGYNDWEHDDRTFLFDLIQAAKGQPKTIIVYKDGNVSKHYFDDIIGVNFNLEKIDAEEKAEIVKAYELWKQENNQ